VQCSARSLALKPQTGEFNYCFMLCEFGHPALSGIIFVSFHCSLSEIWFCGVSIGWCHHTMVVVTLP
jgi:hypothetical protein